MMKEFKINKKALLSLNSLCGDRFKELVYQSLNEWINHTNNSRHSDLLISLNILIEVEDDTINNKPEVDMADVMSQPCLTEVSDYPINSKEDIPYNKEIWNSKSNEVESELEFQPKLVEVNPVSEPKPKDKDLEHIVKQSKVLSDYSVSKFQIRDSLNIGSIPSTPENDVPVNLEELKKNKDKLEIELNYIEESIISLTNEVDTINDKINKLMSESNEKTREFNNLNILLKTINETIDNYVI